MGFSVGGAYTYLDARDKTTNRYLTGRNRHQALVKLAFENARLGINANLRGSFYSKWIVSRVESTNVETIAPAFQLWDLYGSKRLKKGFELSARYILLTTATLLGTTGRSTDPNRAGYSGRRGLTFDSVISAGYAAIWRLSWRHPPPFQMQKKTLRSDALRTASWKRRYPWLPFSGAFHSYREFS